MIRCAIPPDSSCGYAWARRFGSGIPTLVSISMTFASSTSVLQSRWSSKTSLIWAPARYTGFKAEVGCWKIIEMCSPRKARTSAAFICAMSLPPNRISPATTSPGCGIRPMIESEVTDFPHPDSPTRPRTSPRLTWKSAPSTALTTPCLVSKCVLSPRTSRRTSPAGTGKGASVSMALSGRGLAALTCSKWDRGRHGVRHPSG